MWKRRREEKTHVLKVLREVLVPMWYITKSSNLTSPRTRINLMAKESLMRRISHHILPTSRRRPIRRKEHAMFVAILDIGHLVAQTALTSVMGRAARPQMLSLAMLR
jgi:hypothetical protein